MLASIWLLSIDMFFFFSFSLFFILTLFIYYYYYYYCVIYSHNLYRSIQMCPHHSKLQTFRTISAYKQIHKHNLNPYDLNITFWNINSIMSSIIGNKLVDPEFLAEINKSDIIGRAFIMKPWELYLYPILHA